MDEPTRSLGSPGESPTEKLAVDPGAAVEVEGLRAGIDDVIKLINEKLADDPRRVTELKQLVLEIKHRLIWTRCRNLKGV